MKVILLEKIEHLGAIGDVVEVKAGLARNFLLPQEKALRASKENIIVFEAKKVELEKKNDAVKAEAEKVAKTLAGKSFVAVRQAGDTGHLYGSVTTRDIAKLMKDAGFHITSDQIKIGNPIKVVGIFDVIVSLHPEVKETVKINVAKSSEEAFVAEDRIVNPDKHQVVKEEEYSVIPVESDESVERTFKYSDYK